VSEVSASQDGTGVKNARQARVNFACAPNAGTPSAFARDANDSEKTNASTDTQEESSMAVQAVPQAGTGVVRAVTVNLPRPEVYAFWREFENFPRFMKHLESVTVLDSRRSHWVAKAPVGTRIEWDAEIIADEPNSHIAWRSIGEAEVDNSGSVHFSDAPGDRGTEVLVQLSYDAPAGGLGKVVAKMFGEEPEQQVREDLRRFKAIIETDVIPTIIGQPSGEGRTQEEP
jgi:uncharacterized membrane protein